MTNKTINILQWNCRSLPRRLPDLLFLLDKFNISIALLCETKLNDLRTPALTNYDIFTNNRNAHGGGVAILIKKKLRLSIIKNNSLDNICNANHIELLLGKVWLSSNKSLYVCSIYSPPRGSNLRFTDPFAWSSALQLFESYNPILIGGDFNGKSHLWSSNISTPDTEGHKIEDAISLANFVCLNNGTDTWISSDLSSSSALDITLASPSLVNHCHWQTLNYPHGSDHYPIIITIDNLNPNPTFGRPAFSTANIDWLHFQTECNKFTENFNILYNNLNYTYNNLIDNIHQTLISSGASKQPINNIRKKTPAPWWDDECSNIIANKKIYS